MIGAIIGDIVGSEFEHIPIKTKTFDLFSLNSRYTDDTVLTIAIMDAILGGTDYTSSIFDYTLRYRAAGFSGRFIRWVAENAGIIPTPYNSFGNGSAMRVSPVGYISDDIDEVLTEARKTAEITHCHEEGIKGAQSVATAVFLARKGADKSEIKTEIHRRFGYDLTRRVDDIRPGYRFDVTCQGSVPEAIICFLESADYEDAIRNAVSLGGDADTQACVAGSIAEAFYGSIPDEMILDAFNRLPNEFIQVIQKFSDRYGRPGALGKFSSIPYTPPERP